MTRRFRSANTASFTALALLALAAPSAAQAPMPSEAPGKADPARVTSGDYTIDTGHTLVSFVVNHLGFNDYFGLVGGATGTLKLDVANHANDRLSVDIPVNALTINPAINEHLNSPAFFDVARFSRAHFESTAVQTDPRGAAIAGNLTLHGVTKPVTLFARFSGAGVNPMTKAKTVGFEGEAKIKRSEFGVGAFVPLVGDEVTIYITAAFEKANG